MTKLEEELESACKDASAAFEADRDTDTDWDALDHAWAAYFAELNKTKEQTND